MPARKPRVAGLVDVHVGRWLRALRNASGLTREQLASQANLTFQQIQKYEAGQNRMSAGRLAELAAILGVSPADFYLGADVLQKVLGERASRENLALEREVCDLLIAYVQIGSEDERASVLASVQAASERSVKDRAEAIFRPRAATAPAAPGRATEAGVLALVLGSVLGRAALASALAKPRQSSWVKPVVHVHGEIRSRAQI